MSTSRLYLLSFIRLELFLWFAGLLIAPGCGSSHSNDIPTGNSVQSTFVRSEADASESTDLKVRPAKVVAPGSEAYSFTVENSLPSTQADGKLTTYRISHSGLCGLRKVRRAYTPPPRADGTLPSGPRELKVTQRLCIRFAQILHPGESATFYVSEADFADVIGFGGGEAEFEFADDQQLFGETGWPCYAQNIKLGPELQNRHRVTVNQRYTLSYGCLLF